MSTSSPIKGFDKLSSHLPVLKKRFGLARLLLLPALIAFLIYMFFSIEDSTWQLWLLDGEVDATLLYRPTLKFLEV